MTKKGLISILIQEGIEFCYTLESGVIGISKASLTTKYNYRNNNILINMFKGKYDISLTLVNDDIIYAYVKESI